MPDFPKLPIITPPSNQPKFPDLPILEPDPPRMSMRDKYGGLFYLGIGGLIFSVFLVGSFFYQLYRTRALWAAVYVLSDPTSTDPARFEAAWAVAHNPDANDRQRMDFALRKDLPDLARYILAEGLTATSIQADPKAYALSAARSEGWPDWLRLLVARPMAYAVGEGYRIAWEPLDELRDRPDKALNLWMTYTRAVMEPGNAPALEQLQTAARQAGTYQELATLLAEAATTTGPERIAHLDAATAWLRIHHPTCAAVWKGWMIEDGQIRIKLPATQPVPPVRPGPVTAPDKG